MERRLCPLSSLTAAPAPGSTVAGWSLRRPPAPGWSLVSVNAVPMTQDGLQTKLPTLRSPLASNIGDFERDVTVSRMISPRVGPAPPEARSAQTTTSFLWQLACIVYVQDE
ncbi:hypothetical protein EXIGLDRAFT_182982 [Exidia glandulosa HHB12029]|uniref:Uncharacterized protein n=1 Tax=Exidia glandulosa HHB12029 TaxID=1314781 RepID=A0A165F279_EXIGL|nr:hypothetical protein EXIGLDRAFT_182982 [Exidia glandulosa HHB12029]